MEKYEIQPQHYVAKQKEVIAQLTDENIMLSCRVEQLEGEAEQLDETANHYQTRAHDAETRLMELERWQMEKDLSDVPVKEIDPEFEALLQEEEESESARFDVQAAMPTLMERMGVTENTPQTQWTDAESGSVLRGSDFPLA